MGNGALDTFWHEVETKGAPLVEPIPGDETHLWVTFLWRAKEPVRNVVVFSGLTNYAYTRSILPRLQMTELAGTNIWFITLRVRRDARFTYQFSVNDSLIPEEDEKDDSARRARLEPDPLNAHHAQDAVNKTTDAADRESLVEMPGAPVQLWMRQTGKPAGELKQYQFKSEILKNERKINVYTPAGYDTNAKPYPLLILMDGEAYTQNIPTPIILDNLIADKKVPALVAVFINNVTTNQPYARTFELSCNALFTSFLAKEMIPWIRRHYRVTSAPANTVVGGVSRGGLAAACAALEHPELIGNVSSQSGFFPYKDKNWFKRVAPDVAPDDLSQDEKAWDEYGNVMAEFVRRPRQQIRFHLEAGIFENTYHPSVLIANRHLRDVLMAKGYQVQYQEFAGHHSVVNFRGTLPTALVFLFGKTRAR